MSPRLARVLYVDKYKELWNEFMKDKRSKNLGETEQLLSNLRVLERCLSFGRLKHLLEHEFRLGTFIFRHQEPDQGQVFASIVT
jgi:hypothetical protein